jgi:hypothetical protein
MSQDLRLTPSYFPYDARMCFEIALGLDPLEKILDRYGIDKPTFVKLAANTQFKQQIIEFRKEIKDKGLSFKEKAKMMAEDMLTTAYDIIHHTATSAAVKADLIKWTAKIAGYDTPADTQPQNFLPQIQAALRGLSDGELQMRVTEIVLRKQQPQELEAEVLSIH